MVFTDYPDYFADNGRKPYMLDTGKFLDWLLARMSVDPADVALDYTLRCYAQKTLPGRKADRAPIILACNRYRFATIAKCKPKAIVVLGDTSLEAFTGKSKCGEFVEQQVVAWEGVVREFVPKVWVGYNPQYSLFGDPGSTVSLARVLWMAAKQAGLNPKVNTNVEPFKWPTVM